MAYAITITSERGESVDKILRTAMQLLQLERIAVEAGAPVITEAEHLVIVLLGTEAARVAALKLLAEAGFAVKSGGG